MQAGFVLLLLPVLSSLRGIPLDQLPNYLAEGERLLSFLPASPTRFVNSVLAVTSSPLTWVWVSAQYVIRVDESSGSDHGRWIMEETAKADVRLVVNEAWAAYVFHLASDNLRDTQGIVTTTICQHCSLSASVSFPEM